MPKKFELAISAIVIIFFFVISGSIGTNGSDLSAGNASLIVVNKVNDTLDGRVNSSDFKMVVSNVNLGDTASRVVTISEAINGSELGTKVEVLPGTFSIVDNSMTSSPLTLAFNKTYSGDCQASRSGGFTVGMGTVNSSETKTCHITRNLNR